jgi:predicted DNA-binding transcriptional regulator AlpA
MLGHFQWRYESAELSRIHRIIAIGESHHRLAWIHPFHDSNGRVVRLFSDALMDADASLSLEKRDLLNKSTGDVVSTTAPSTGTPNERRFLRSGAVMALLGYPNRAAFWEFVHRKGVPHVRLSARKIVFDEGGLRDWIERRSTAAR